MTMERKFAKDISRFLTAMLILCTGYTFGSHDILAGVISLVVAVALFFTLLGLITWLYTMTTAEETEKGVPNDDH